jgi:hypothetical protein
LFDSNLADTSKNGITLSPLGNASVNTNIYKYGGGSVYFDGNGDYLTIPSQSDFGAFGLGDFTIEWWQYVVNYNNYFTVMNYGNLGITIPNVQSSAYSARWGITFQNANTLHFSYGSNQSSVFNNLNILVNNWYHIALVRRNGNLNLFINGVKHASTYNLSSINLTQGTSTSIVGATRLTFISSDLLYSSNGYLDSLRVTKDIARYVSKFTPPGPNFE